ncbi:type II secretion system protein GspM [Pseudomonas moorei]|jgi:general secretion pathway protein M|uniref:General secretion pathway protein M n=1 Tax=Pseudomonas moorei TaxID=395599 RepID=A0A1H1J7E9_9PSED|nr:type II secretion system protein GspM [Pseudomonas moorei]KAB0505695.1 type II secretion system protein M [Pseudomonas moorei]SDR45907.1 general secretion pathway protein M [Pseudomonas moorei]
MKPSEFKAATLQRWQRLSIREQRLLGGLGVFVLGVAVFSLVWQPTQQRLITAERQYQQQLTLAARLQQAQPRSHVPGPVDQPLSLRISESAATAGLELQQMNSDNDLLRLTVSGDAMTLLPWLDRIERDGIALQSLTLEKRDAVLEARLVLR